MSAAEYEIFEVAAFGEEHYGESPYDRIAAPGWYWWFRLPDSMPNTEPVGPFFSEEEAKRDAPGATWRELSP